MVRFRYRAEGGMIEEEEEPTTLPIGHALALHPSLPSPFLADMCMGSGLASNTSDEFNILKAK